MRVIGLLSGGKDSCFNLMHCVAGGHEIVGLATLAPPEGQSGEMDSWMYQTAGHDAVPFVAQAMGLSLYHGHIQGSAHDTGAQYVGGDETDETEDLARLLRSVLVAHPDADAVSVGAIESNYQRVRVEHVCARLDLSVLAFLWKRPQATLVNEMVAAGLEAVLIKVAGAGLGARDLGKSLGLLRPKLDRLARVYGAHVAGEGGEYETLTLDSPLHVKGKVELGETKVVMHTDTGGIADVAYLAAREARLVPKTSDALGALESLKTGTIPRPPVLDKFSTSVAQTLPPGSEGPSRMYPPHHWAPWSPSAASFARHRDRCTITVACAHEGGMKQAAQQAFEQVSTTLQAHGLQIQFPTSSQSREGEFVVMDHVNVYLSSQEHFALLNKEYGKHFGVAPPSRACIALPTSQDQSGVMLTLTGRIGEAKGDARHARSALHVQSRSYWAPANIGPYAQAVISRGTVSIAGQIALVPANMLVPIEGGTQAILALQHVRRILRAALVDLTAAPLAPPEEGNRHFIQGGIAWVTGRGTLGTEAVGAQHGPDNEYISARALAEAAHVAWTHSGGESDEDKDEDEVMGDGKGSDPEQKASDAWHAAWMGQTPSAPVLYPVLPSDALPRNARIEWQVLAHTGVPCPELVEQVKATSQSADSDDEEEPRVQAYVSVSTGDGFVQYDVLGSYGDHTVSRFRIDLIRLSDGVPSAMSSDEEWGEVRVLVPPRTDLDTLRSALSPHAIVLPVLDLFAPHPTTYQIESWDAAIVSTL